MDLNPEHFGAKHRHFLKTSNAQINLLHGAIRSTKTVISILRWLKFVAEEAPAGAPLAMIGKTHTTIFENVIEPMRQIVGRDLKVVRGQQRCYLWGRVIRLMGANNEGAEEKLRGATLGGVYGDEVSTWPQNFFNRAIDRMSIAGSKFFGTTNPEGPMHWLKVNYLDRVDVIDLNVYHFLLEDNPWLSDWYIDNMKAIHPPGSLWYRRFILGEWVAAEGAVFDMWEPAKHILRGPMPERRDIGRSWGGIDYGTVNPFVALGLHHATKERDRIVVAPEWRHDSIRKMRQMTDGQYVTALMKWGADLPLVQGLERWYIDPSAASFIRQMHLDGFRVGLANNDVIDGIRSVSSLLAADRLRVHESCEDLIAEISGYVWDSARQDKGEDAPLKVNDHGCDAMRYGIQSERRVWRRWNLGQRPKAA